MASFTKRLFVTWSALTHTTERATKRRGSRYFLPALFVDRFANLGGIDKAVFTRQLDECRSFDDASWVAYWWTLAQTHLDNADRALEELNAPAVAALLDPVEQDAVDRLGTVLSPAVNVFADRTPENAATLVTEFTRSHPDDAAAAIAIDELVKAMTYLFAASWPGWTPERLNAYTHSQRIFHALLFALAPAMGVHVERLRLNLTGEEAFAYAVFPTSRGPHPTVLITNGLEGTIQEVLLPSLRHRTRGIALVVMEMPGTFQYTSPLTTQSADIYQAVIAQLAEHPRVAADRMGMLGLSFGAHWSTRMAATNPHLKAVMSNGGLYHRSFAASATFGMPEIMLWALQKATGATNLGDLGRKLHAFSIKNLYAHVNIPILVINGSDDTLISTQDSIDLAAAAPHAELILYPDDDHCAMGHYTEWLDASTDWLAAHLGSRSADVDRRTLDS